VVPVLLAVVAAVALVWLMARLYNQYSAHSYQAAVVRYGNVTDTQVTVTFEVRKPAGDSALCRLRALDRSGVETGYAEVKVGTGDRVTTTYTIGTKKRAAAVDLLGCNAAPR
jgi:hypothetical protein